MEHFNCPLRHCGFPRHHCCWAEILNHLGWWDDPPPTGTKGAEPPRTCFYSEMIWWNDVYLCYHICIFNFCTCIHYTYSMYFLYHTQFLMQLDCIWMCIYITCVLRIGVTPIFSRSRDSQQSTASAKAARTSAWRRIGRKAKFGEGWNFFSNECFFLGGFWRGVCMKLHFCDFLDVYFLDSFFEKSLSLFLSTGIEIWNL